MAAAAVAHLQPYGTARPRSWRLKTRGGRGGSVPSKPRHALPPVISAPFSGVAQYPLRYHPCWPSTLFTFTRVHSRALVRWSIWYWRERRHAAEPDARQQRTSAAHGAHQVPQEDAGVATELRVLAALYEAGKRELP